MPDEGSTGVREPGPSRGGRIRSLSDVYDSDVVHAPAASHRAREWLPPGELVPCAITGSQLGIAGGTTIQCSAAAATPAGLELVAEGGHPPPGDVVTYRDEAERIGQLRDWAATGRRIAVQHVLPPDELPPSAYLVPRDLLSRLNDKGHLGEVVPPRAVAQRWVTTPDRLHDPPIPPPFFVKASSWQTSGAGAAVMACRDPEDLSAARLRFAECERVVVERWIPHRRSWCAGYAVLSDGRVEYLGALLQTCTGAGGYVGGRIEPDDRPPVPGVELGRGIAETGAAMGFRGPLGMDMCEEAEGRVVILDLNFRINASTPVVMARPRLEERRGAFHAVFGKRVATRGRGDAVRAARTAARAGWFVPFGAFDPPAIGREEPFAVTGLLIGESREELAARGEELASMGLAAP